MGNEKFRPPAKKEVKPDPPPEVVPFESEGAKPGFTLDMSDDVYMDVLLGRGS